MKTTSSIIAFAITVVAGLFAIPVYAQTDHHSDKAEAVYVARLQPMNSNVGGDKATGEARFVFNGDRLTISIKVKGAQPHIEHWQHFHGFKDNLTATCPTMTADANADGVIDIVETEPAVGTTMVPFDANPIAMDVAHGAYPKAKADGSYDYETTVSLKALDAAFHKQFGDTSLNLDRRVVMIHGVSPETKLATTVASLGDIPARVTLPIACGRIEKVTQMSSGM